MSPLHVKWKTNSKKQRVTVLQNEVVGVWMDWCLFCMIVGRGRGGVSKQTYSAGWGGVGSCAGETRHCSTETRGGGESCRWKREVSGHFHHLCTLLIPSTPWPVFRHNTNIILHQTIILHESTLHILCLSVEVFLASVWSCVCSVQRNEGYWEQSIKRWREDGDPGDAAEGG